MAKITIYINGNTVSKETIDNWELQRLNHVTKSLIRKGCPVTITSKENDVTHFREELARFKSNQKPDLFRELYKRQYRFGNFVSKLTAKLSFGKRKFCSTEFVVPESDLSPEDVMANIETIMLENTPEHLYMNLATNPDHFVLIATDTNVQEVLETTGGSPMPTRFFAHYGKEDKLASKLGDGYTVQAPAVAKLEDGTIIGGIRHQVRAEGNGFRFKALVEFPALLPNFMIKQHQYHLACEFRQWLGYVIEDT